MNDGERLLANWLTAQGCHWVFIDQSAGLSADGAFRANPRMPLHRPDFLAFTDGMGTVALDVKDYDVKGRTFRVHFHDSPPEEWPFSYVELIWSDIVGLHHFESVSGIPTWLCILVGSHSGIRGDADAPEVPALFYRSRQIYETFSPLFEHLGVIDLVCDPPHYMNDHKWPIELDRKDRFAFLVDFSQFVNDEVNPNWCIKPKVIAITGDTHLGQILGLRGALDRLSSLPPTEGNAKLH